GRGQAAVKPRISGLPSGAKRLRSREKRILPFGERRVGSGKRSGAPGPGSQPQVLPPGESVTPPESSTRRIRESWLRHPLNGKPAASALAQGADFALGKRLPGAGNRRIAWAPRK